MSYPSFDMSRKAHLLRIRVRRMIQGTKFGAQRTARVTPSGVEFVGLREYQQGDDIRAIDWKSSARSTRLIVRSYEEESNKTIIIVVDATASMQYGSGALLKEDIARDLAIMVAYAAEFSGDAVGIVVVGGEEQISWIPPRAGKQHIAVIVERLLSLKSAGTVSDWREVNRYIFLSARKNALIIFLSDGIGRYFVKLLHELARKHVVVFGCIRDKVEYQGIFTLGLKMLDPEFGTTAEVMTRYQRSQMERHLSMWYEQQQKELRATRVNHVDLVACVSHEDALLRVLQKGLV